MPRKTIPKTRYSRANSNEFKHITLTEKEDNDGTIWGLLKNYPFQEGSGEDGEGGGGGCGGSGGSKPSACSVSSTTSQNVDALDQRLRLECETNKIIKDYRNRQAVFVDMEPENRSDNKKSNICQQQNHIRNYLIDNFNTTVLPINSLELMDKARKCFSQKQSEMDSKTMHWLWETEHQRIKRMCSNDIPLIESAKEKSNKDELISGFSSSLNMLGHKKKCKFFVSNTPLIRCHSSAIEENTHERRDSASLPSKGKKLPPMLTIYRKTEIFLDENKVNFGSGRVLSFTSNK